MLDEQKELPRLISEWFAHGKRGPWPLAVWGGLRGERLIREQEWLAGEFVPELAPRILKTGDTVPRPDYPPLPDGSEAPRMLIDLRMSASAYETAARHHRQEMGLDPFRTRGPKQRIHQDPILAVVLFYEDIWNPGQRASLAARFVACGKELEDKHERQVNRIIDDMRTWLKERGFAVESDLP